jgi:hypothetical protein
LKLTRFDEFSGDSIPKPPVSQHNFSQLPLQTPQFRLAT